MVTIGQCLIRTASFCMFALVLAAGARSELPAVLDRIPPGSNTIVAIGSLARFDQNTSDLITSLEMDAISTFSQALGALGLRDGLDMQGSAAGVIYPAAEGVTSKSARYVLLIPLANYDVFSKNMRAQRDGDLDRFEYAQKTYYARKLADGSFVAICQQRDLAQAFPDQGGQMALHQRAIGARGMHIAETADIIAIVPVDKAHPLIAGALDPLFQKMDRSFPGIGDEDNNSSSLAQSLVNRVEREGQTVTVALAASPLGLKLDIAVRFQDGSEMTQLAQNNEARGGNLFAHLPNDPALLVGSVNLAHPGVRTLIADALEELVIEPGHDIDLASQLSLTMFLALKDMDSVGIAVYSPPALFSGLLSRTAIVWEGDEPALAVGTFKSWLGIAGQQDSLNTTYSRGAQQVAGASLDSWTIIPDSAALVPDPLLGMGGIKGFISINDERGIMLWFQDETSIASILNPAEPMTQNLMLSQVGELLPDDRAIEWYLNPGPILTMAAPMLAMLTRGQPLEVPEMLPPIGASLSLGDGALHTTIFIPAPLIRFAFDIKDVVGTGIGGS